MAASKRPTTSQPIDLFYSYSHRDERLRNELEKHLIMLQRDGIIRGWHDRRITAGNEWEGQIDKRLNEAKVILLLISPDFLFSKYCYDIETKRALWRHSRKLARVIPVILRPCDWSSSPIGKLQALPKDGKPITEWPNRDRAFTEVTQGIRKALAELTPTASSTKPKPKPATKPPATGKTATANKADSGLAEPAPAKPVKPTKSRPKGNISPAPAVAGTTKKSGTPTAKQPDRPPQSSRRGNTTATATATASKPKPGRTLPELQLLPRETAAKYIERAFQERPAANLGVVWLMGVWASLRADAPINPPVFLEEGFQREVQSLAHAGSAPLLGFGTSNEPHINTSRLQIVQHDTRRGERLMAARSEAGYDVVELRLYANGAVSVALNVTNLTGDAADDFYGYGPINPDNVQRRLEQAWSFVARWWRHRFGTRVPGPGQGQDVLLFNIGLFDATNREFRKLQPHHGRTRVISFGDSYRARPNPLLAYDEPKLINRAMLLKPGSELRDTVKLLQMRYDETGS